MRDLFDIGAQSQPGERQTDIELIIEEKTMATENDKRMEIANKAHAIQFGGSETGMIYAVEWNGKSYTAADTRELVDKVMADIEYEYKPVDGCEECEFMETACAECIMYGEAEKVEVK